MWVSLYSLWQATAYHALEPIIIFVSTMMTNSYPPNLMDYLYFIKIVGYRTRISIFDSSLSKSVMIKYGSMGI